MSTFRLSRLDLIEDYIDESTPNLVIIEIALCHGISLPEEAVTSANRDSIVQAIQQASIWSINDTSIAHRDWRYIARYVNPLVQVWPNGNLLRDAFRFLRRHIRIQLEDLDFNFQSGSQTPDQPFRINSCLLYGLCHRHGITTRPEMPIQEMELAVKGLLTPPLVLIGSIVDQLRQSTRGQIVDLYLHRHKQQPSLRPLVKMETPTLDNLSSITSSFIPQQLYQAVGLVGMKWRLDISSSLYPIEEYIELSVTGYFHPIDPIISKYYAINPDLYSLEEEFNPIFPPSYYSSETLTRLGSRFGIQDDVYTGLCLVDASNSFYHGIRPGILNRVSPFMYTSMEEVSSDDIIVFGNRLDGYTFFTYTELADYLRLGQSFLNPINRSRLSSSQILRLRYLGMSQSSTQTSRRIQNQRYLNQAIESIDRINRDIDSRLDNLFLMYQQADLNQRTTIQHLLRTLIDMAMYMRGWMGPPEPLPIQSAPYRPSCDVAIRVSTSLMDWLNHLHQLPTNWIELIEGLDLLRYQDGFVASNDDEIGRTISDKIRMIQDGENHPSTLGSCIRASSSWIATSGYRYMTRLGLDPPFKVEDLVYVT